MFILQQELPKKFNKNLKNRFANAYKLSNHDNNNYILSLQKSV